MTADKIENEIKAIKERNERVESDKAWETSKTRRAIIAISVYVFAIVILFLIRAPDPLVNALVPVAGFWISTLTLPIFKNWWLRQFYKKGR